MQPRRLVPGAARIARETGESEDELPNNIINSLYSCVEGENRQAQIRQDFETIPRSPPPELNPAPEEPVAKE